MFYNARYYSPLLSRFVSADTVVPGESNPQAFNRYMYTLGNPLRLTDPTGHDPCGGPGVFVPDCGVEDDNSSLPILTPNPSNNPPGLPGSSTDNGNQPNIPLNNSNEHSNLVSQPNPCLAINPQCGDYWSFSYYTTTPIKILALLLIGVSTSTPIPEDIVADPLAVALYLQQVVSVGGTITIDKYGQVFIAPGLAIGRTSILGVPTADPSVQIVSGRLWNRAQGPQDTSALLSGVSFSHGATLIFTANFVWTPSSTAKSSEFGMGLQNVNVVTASYGFGPFQIPKFWP